MAEMLENGTTAEVTSTEEPKPARAESVDKKQTKAEAVDIQAQIEQLMIENAKLKRAVDKASADASDYKKRYNATLSEKELMDAEKAEAEAEKQARFEAMERELKISRLEKSYLAMSFTADEASRMAIAEADGDVDAKLKIMKESDARKRKEYEAEFMKNRPPVNAGVGGETPSITKEQFDKMGYLERKEFKAKYPETYAEYVK